MVPRTPTGDLVAALVLFGAVALLVYVSASDRDAQFAFINRRRHPILFWIGVAMVGVITALVAVLLAWEASATLLRG
jgi:hypothetical protein